MASCFTCHNSGGGGWFFHYGSQAFPEATLGLQWCVKITFACSLFQCCKWSYYIRWCCSLSYCSLWCSGRKPIVENGLLTPCQMLLNVIWSSTFSAAVFLLVSRQWMLLSRVFEEVRLSMFTSQMSSKALQLSGALQLLGVVPLPWLGSSSLQTVCDSKQIGRLQKTGIPRKP